ncbi:Gibberellin receptor [Salvia divinorum]|uniref:Gibberellin receptor n=1 Tax=Salvia divinorum TaxID=28513 RepID=A0ABD1HTD1_SALDI
MSGSNEVNRVVPLHIWILISTFKLSYNMLRQSDGTFNRDLNEFLDRNVAANVVPVDGTYSFDTVDQPTGLVNRIYLPAFDNEPQLGIVEVEKPLSTSEVVPVIVFFHGGSFVHSLASSAIYDTFCRRPVKTCKAAVVSVNYRRSPEHRYPCAYDDGLTALNSGGNIAHHVALRATEEGMEKEIGIGEPTYQKAKIGTIRPALCSALGVKPLKGLVFQRVLVVVVGLDLHQDWQIGYVEGLKKYGHDVKLLYLEKATIGFYFLPNNEHFESLMDEIKTFIQS